ncbi:hypothetical protein EDB87DRAFT_1625581 [Lactarius vividus]|nr:hypothetical protein EDB87DRAFT_1625581 [Lactarius vividus]
MIRRNPTLIGMSDADVQDVRNMLAKKQQQQQAENITSANSNTTAAKGKHGFPPQPPTTAVHVTDEAKQRREARDERLGLNN